MQKGYYDYGRRNKPRELFGLTACPDIKAAAEAKAAEAKAAEAKAAEAKAAEDKATEGGE